MSEWDEIRTAPLGSVRDHRVLNKFYRRILGSTVAPSKQKGYSCIIGERAPDGQPTEYYLLDEYENANLMSLIHWSVASWKPYRPEVWFGDPRNIAARQLVADYNQQLDVSFALTPSSISDMPQLYSYIIPVLRDLFSPKIRRAFMGQSLCRAKLASIKLDEIPAMRGGDLPAVEALGIVLLEAEHRREIPLHLLEDDMSVANSYAQPNSLFR